MTEVKPKEEPTPIKEEYYFTFYNDKDQAKEPQSTNPDIKTPEV